jgi:hypothetical protein
MTSPLVLRPCQAHCSAPPARAMGKALKWTALSHAAPRGGRAPWRVRQLPFHVESPIQDAGASSSPRTRAGKG